MRYKVNISYGQDNLNDILIKILNRELKKMIIEKEDELKIDEL